MGLPNYQNYPENGASQLPKLSRKWGFPITKIIQKMGLPNYQNYPENGAFQLPKLSRKWGFPITKIITEIIQKMGLPKTWIKAIWGWFPLLTMIPGFGITGFGHGNWSCHPPEVTSGGPATSRRCRFFFWFPWQVDDLMVGLWDIMGIYLTIVITGWFMGYTTLYNYKLPLNYH